jgi:hypothetical protein
VIRVKPKDSARALLLIAAEPLVTHLKWPQNPLTPVHYACTWVHEGAGEQEEVLNNTFLEMKRSRRRLLQERARTTTALPIMLALLPVFAAIATAGMAGLIGSPALPQSLLRVEQILTPDGTATFAKTLGVEASMLLPVVLLAPSPTALTIVGVMCRLMATFTSLWRMFRQSSKWRFASFAGIMSAVH